MIRRATADDAPEIRALEALCNPEAWSEAALRDHLALPTTRAWVAEGGHLVGSLVGDEAELQLLAVRPEARRRGLARALLAAAASAWAGEGADRAFLEVRADNAPALALYAGAGWARAGLRRAYYQGGVDAVILALRLVEAPC